MATGPMNEVIRHLRGAAVACEPAWPSDGQLLGCFIHYHDEAAFAAIVRRHGPMVMGVCRRILRNPHDAEDAFQATFLVLVRKATSVVPREMVGNWLYGVAQTTAVRAKVSVAKRRLRERQVVDIPEPEDNQSATDQWSELRQILDQELIRLPSKYRVPIVACDLEGKSIKEAAGQLGWPQGTVAGRLARARNLLSKRLARYGRTVSALSLAEMLPQQAGAGVPASVVSSTIKVAYLDATKPLAAGATISAPVAALVEGVLKTMLLTKLKIATAALLVGLGVILSGAGLIAHQLRADEQINPSQQATVELAAKEAAKPAAEEKDDSVSVKSMPPVVVKTIPQAGDTAVDAAAIAEIRVTFSKEMADKSWSWSQISDESFPKSAGKIHYDKDNRTCIMPVKLEPGKTYVIWLNPPKFQGFRDSEGNAAIFYPLVFQTKP